MEILIWVVAVDVVVFGSLTGWLAGTKNRSGSAWFLLGSLLGPLALLAVGLAPSANPDTDGLAAWMPADSTKKCPDCGEEVRAEAVICRFCRHRFAPEERGDPFDLKRELEAWESLGTWIVASCQNDQIAIGETVELGVGATHLIVLVGESAALTVALRNGFLDRAGDRLLSLSENGRPLATFRWYSGPKAKDAMKLLDRAKVPAGLREP